MYVSSLFVRHIAFLLSRLTAMPIVLSFVLHYNYYMIIKGIAIVHTHMVTLFRYINIAMRSRFQYTSYPIQLY